MLNSKDKFVQSLIEYFKLVGVGIELNDQKVIVRDSLISKNIIFHSVIAVLIPKFISTVSGNLYLSSLIFLYSIIAYVIFWIDYKSINVIEFDLLNKYIHIQNRSIIRRILSKYIQPQQSSKYYFEDCRSVEIVPNKIMSFFDVKNFVNLKLQSGMSLKLIGFSEDVSPQLFSKLVTTLIASN